MRAKSIRNRMAYGVQVAVAATAVAFASTAYADDYHRSKSHITPYAPQMAADTGLGWGTNSVFTIGESIGDYTPPGIPDGMFAWGRRHGKVELLVNHELTADAGYPYVLKSGAILTGARVSYFDIDRDTRRVTKAGLAYDTIYSRAGKVVSSPADLEFGGLNRLCSANGVRKGDFGFVDDIFFTGEETGGGTEWALDVKSEKLWAAPAMGRAAWESVTAIQPPSHRHVALLVGDDRQAAPLLLYVGKKYSGKKGGNFLARNGLAKGNVYVWVSDTGDIDPSHFNGTGATRSGKFVEIKVYDPKMAGQPGYDDLGYADQDTQDAMAAAVGAFQFSRPEDVGTNPANHLQVAFASTGRPSLFPDDSWGTTYQVDVSYSWENGKLMPKGFLTVLYDGDDAGAGQFPGPDYGLRSPDNLTWADNGKIYLQEDRSIGDFGLTSGQEASIWELNPQDGSLLRIAQIDRNVVAPVGVTDSDPLDIGDWESSGIIDVTSLFKTEPGETLLLGNTQAHSIRDGVIGGKEGLVQGGQLFFLNEWAVIEE